MTNENGGYKTISPQTGTMPAPQSRQEYLDRVIQAGKAMPGEVGFRVDQDYESEINENGAEVRVIPMYLTLPLPNPEGFDDVDGFNEGECEYAEMMGNRGGYSARDPVIPGSRQRHTRTPP